jgi:RNA recognition motif-containing protein
MTNKLFVGGLAWATTDPQLADFFATKGTVVSAKVITDKYSGRSKGFGFVEMSTPEEAEKAMQELDGAMLNERAINVKEALPQTDKPSNGPRQGGGGYRGGGNSRGGGYNNNRGGGYGDRDNRSY